MSRSTVALVTILVLAGTLAVAGPAAAAPDFDCAGSGGGAMVVADSGFTVEYNGSEPIQSELAYNGDDGIRVPDVNLSSSASSASVRVEDGTGPETCLAAIDASVETIRVDPDGEQAVEIEGEVQTLSLADADYGDGSVDFAYVSNDNWRLTLYDTGLSQGASVEATQSGGSVLYTGTVGANGVLTLQLPSGYYDVDLREAGGGSGGGAGGGQFSVVSASANASQVAVGEAVGVTAEVRNDGSSSGQYTATLTVDGVSVDTATVTVAANDAETVTLSTSFGQDGSYQLAVDGESAGTVTVGAGGGSGSISLSGFQVDPSSAAPGDTVTVSGQVENTGSQSVTEQIALAVDGQTIETRSVQVGPGQSETVSFEYTVQSTGERTISVGGQQVGTVQVAADSGGDGGNGGSGLPWLAIVAGAVLLIAVAAVGYARYGGGTDADPAAGGDAGAGGDGASTGAADAPALQAASEEAEPGDADPDAAPAAAAEPPADGEAGGGDDGAADGADGDGEADEAGGESAGEEDGAASESGDDGPTESDDGAAAESEDEAAESGDETEEATTESGDAEGEEAGETSDEGTEETGETDEDASESDDAEGDEAEEVGDEGVEDSDETDDDEAAGE